MTAAMSLSKTVDELDLMGKMAQIKSKAREVKISDEKYERMFLEGK